MISLIWKEAREKLLWATALCLISMFSAWTCGYTFYGAPWPEMLSWSLGPILMAFLMGASGFASELTSRRAVFLLTRPVTWRSILISKIIIGACAILAASVLAAIAYRLTCPPSYTGLVTTSGLAEGIWLAVIFTGFSFLTGFASSSVFAGTTESAAFAIVQGTVLICVFSILGARSIGWSQQIMQVLWPIPLLVAGVAVVKSGVALSAGERVRRYGVTAFAGIVVLAVAANITPRSLIDDFISDKVNYEYIDWSISPDGLYALGRDMRNIYRLDVRHDKCTKLEYVFEDYSAHRVISEAVSWMSPHIAYRIACGKDTWFIRTYYLENNGVKNYDIPMGKLTDRDGYPTEIVPSPDGRTAAVLLSVGMDKPRTIVFVDIAERRRLKREATTAAGTPMWWNPSSEFRYIDARGNANMIELTK